MPNLVAGGRQAGGTAIDHVDRAGTSIPDYPEALSRDPNCQVFKAIVVEVTGGQRITKEVQEVSHAGNAVAVLVPNLVAGSRQAGGTAINHVDYTGKITVY